METEVREAFIGDYAAIGRLYFETVRTVNRRDYGHAQVTAWAPSIQSSRTWRERLRGQLVLVATEQQRLVGFIAMEVDGHLDLLYVHKDRQRRGIATQLLDRAIAAARRRKLSRLVTEASVTARPFFECHGFIVRSAEDVRRGGVVLRRYRMEREL
jgi:putative acetyltransferase